MPLKLTSTLLTVADPDLQIRGSGGGHPDPEIRGRPGLIKKFFGPSGLSLVIRAGGPPGPLPWIRH